MCPGIFVKGPERYIQALHVEVPSVVSPGRAAVVDSTQRVCIGHDVFYFSSPSEQRRFLADPLRYARRLSDPVTQQRFRPTERSPYLTWRGRTYYFASLASYLKFRAVPDSFAVRKGM